MTKRKPYPRRPVMERFWEKVAVPGPMGQGCWLWTASTGSHGYGQLTIEKGVVALAHRLSYEHHVGPIPPGMSIDHLCATRRCVNPLHMEVVSLRENTRRQFERIRAAA